LKKTAADPSQITRDYVRNSSLLINLAKAIGRLTISYKEIQELAGYTSLVADINEVFQNLRKGQYKRRVVDKKKINKDEIDLGYSAQIENS
jgi:ATP-binding cassette subfamily D (ALD) protein 3